MKNLDQYFTSQWKRKHQILEWGYTEDPSPASYDHFSKWVQSGNAGVLNYLTDHRKELRMDLRKLYPDFQSALVFLHSYSDFKSKLFYWYQKNIMSPVLKIAGYAGAFEGYDYHFVLKQNLENIFKELEKLVPGLERFIAVDTAPLLERDLAYKCSLGWFGKNSMLIHPKHGSYFFISVLLLNRKLPNLSHSKLLETDHCGNCRACIDACPTSAIDPNSRTIEANKCVSTYTIELTQENEDLKKNQYEKSNYMFGCDICQDVCPWNRKSLRNEFSHSQNISITNGDFLPPSFQFFKDKSLQKLEEQMMELSSRGFRRLMDKTPFVRPGKNGLLKNLKLFKKST